uniref:Uncharacterized protein n=1 Tax=Anguilla anguilla TaxID=7936 RepID=A0A0E9V076_ANGAN
MFTQAFLQRAFTGTWVNPDFQARCEMTNSP